MTTRIQGSTLRLLMARAGWNISEQVLSSGSSAVIAVLVARSSDARGFGAFAVTLSVYSIAIAVISAVGGQPYQVLCAGLEGAEAREQASEAAGATLASSLVGSVLTAVGALTQSGPTRTALLAFAAVLPVLMLQDTWRAILKTQGRAATATLATAALLVVEVGLLLIVKAAGAHGAVPGILAWAAAALAALVISTAAAKAPPHLRHLRRWWDRVRHLVGYYIGDSVTSTAAPAITVLLLAAVLSASAVGSLRGALVLLGPLNVLGFSAFAFAVPEVSKRTWLSPAKVRLLGLLVGLGLAGVAAVYGAVLLLLPDSVGHGLLGPTWTSTSHILLPAAVGPVIVGAKTGAVTILRARQRVRPMTVLNVVQSVLTVGLGLGFAEPWGIRGATWGFAVAELAILPLWIRSAWRAAGEPVEPPSAPAQSPYEPLVALARRVRLTTWIGPVAFAAIATFFAIDYAAHAVDPTMPLPDANSLSNLRLLDFRDIIWVPVRDLFAGHDPYSVAGYLQRHPTSQPFELYSPWHLLITAPFAALPWSAATVAWGLANVGVWTGAVWVVARRNLWVWGAACVLLCTLPVRSGFQVGQVTPEIVLGTVLALRWSRDKPWLAGVGLVLAGLKPTFLPLLVLVLLLDRSWRTLAWGAFLATELGLTVFGAVLIEEGGPGGLLKVFRANAQHASDTEVFYKLDSPVQTRVDTNGLLGHLGWVPPGAVQALVPLLCAVVVVLVARRSLAVERGSLLARPALVAVLCAATLSAFPHGFDMTLLAVPLMSLALRWPQDRSLWLVGLVSVSPFLHLRRLDHVLAGHPVEFAGSTAVDGVLVLLVLVVGTVVGLRRTVQLPPPLRAAPPRANPQEALTS